MLPFGVYIYIIFNYLGTLVLPPGWSLIISWIISILVYLFKPVTWITTADDLNRFIIYLPAFAIVASILGYIMARWGLETEPNVSLKWTIGYDGVFIFYMAIVFGTGILFYTFENVSNLTVWTAVTWTAVIVGFECVGLFAIVKSFIDGWEHHMESGEGNFSTIPFINQPTGSLESQEVVEPHIKWRRFAVVNAIDYLGATVLMLTSAINYATPLYSDLYAGIFIESGLFLHILIVLGLNNYYKHK